MKRTVIVYLLGLLVFGAVSENRLLEHSKDNHYVYMAHGFIHGRLHVDGRPPHLNDWAKYNNKWYVSFPPVPAILMIPGVAIFGLEFNDRIFTLFFAALGPALLFLLLELLVSMGRIKRRLFEIALLSAVYGIGTVYFFSAVQGSVWYTAHMVGGVFVLLFAIASLNGRHPVPAGAFLGLAFACRPPLLMAFLFFVYEFLNAQSSVESDNSVGLLHWMGNAVKTAGISKIAKSIALFALPVVAIIGLTMLFNFARFGDPFEFGHKHLEIRWRHRIDTYGLFNYHYLSRNLAVALTFLPWISAEKPYIGVSLHGLAIWFTTPVFLWVLFPQKGGKFYAFLAITAAALAIPSLFYQNTGWIQFGYRFSLDYTPFLLLMAAASKRRFRTLFIAACVFAIAVNLFGAVTFDRYLEYYPSLSTKHYFQPD